MIAFVHQVFARGKWPWAFLAVAVVATFIQFHRGWRDGLIYDRGALAAGEWWRIWTGQIVHFGWPHFLADTGLFLLLGRVLEREHPVASRVALAVMPLAIAAGIHVFDPTMMRYAGLSAMNVGLLVFLACRGWQRSWTDWFWPAVLAVHGLEVVLEATTRHGAGGAMIPFDDATVHVATSAHLAGAIFGVVLWLGSRRTATVTASSAGVEFIG